MLLTEMGMEGNGLVRSTFHCQELWMDVVKVPQRLYLSLSKGRDGLWLPQPRDSTSVHLLCVRMCVYMHIIHESVNAAHNH